MEDVVVWTLPRHPIFRHPGRALALALALAGHLACAPGSEELPAPEAPNPLYVDPAGYDFDDNPKLLEKLVAEPHRYLRFVNVPFSQEVCRRFSAEVAASPAVNLHGDALRRSKRPAVIWRG